DHAARLARDLGDVLAPSLVVVLVDVGAREAGEPLVQVRRPLAGTAGIGGCNQAKRGKVVGILLTLAYLYGRVRRRRQQLGQAIRECRTFRLALYPLPVF